MVEDGFRSLSVAWNFLSKYAVLELLRSCPSSSSIAPAGCRSHTTPTLEILPDTDLFYHDGFLYSLVVDT